MQDVDKSFEWRYMNLSIDTENSIYIYMYVCMYVSMYVCMYVNVIMNDCLSEDIIFNAS